MLKKDIIKDITKSLNKMTKPELLELQKRIIEGEPKELGKIDIVFTVQSHNNAHLGYKEYGGELFNRAKVHVHNNESGNEIHVAVNYRVPSGYGDGSTKGTRKSFMVTPRGVKDILKDGSRKFFKNYLGIREVLDYADQSPYTRHI